MTHWTFTQSPRAAFSDLQFFGPLHLRVSALDELVVFGEKLVQFLGLSVADLLILLLLEDLLLGGLRHAGGLSHGP